MFISRIHLDPRRRGTKQAMANPNHFHAHVQKVLSQGPGTPVDGRGRPLWRLERAGGFPTLYVVSKTRPDLSLTQSQYGSPDAPPEYHDYTRRLDAIERGQIWSFRLVANPTHNISRKKDGKIIRTPHRVVKFQSEWLGYQGDRNGFSILGEPVISSLATSTFSRREEGPKGPKVTVASCIFAGRLEVTDPDKFRKALMLGVGRARAYGCGLLTVAPVQVEATNK